MCYYGKCKIIIIYICLLLYTYFGASFWGITTIGV